MELDNVSLETEGNSTTGEKAWQDRLLKIGAGESPPGVDSVIVREIAIGDGLRGVYYHGDDLVPESISLTALSETESRLLWFNVESLVGNEDLMAEIVGEIASAYKTLADGDYPPGPDWFCIPGGAIERPTQTMERVEYHFEHPDAEMELDLEISTTPDPQREGLIDRLDSLLEAYFGTDTDGESIEKIRMQTREVAGMRGEEAVLRETQDGEVSLSFTWEFPGETDSGLKPHFKIELNGPDQPDKMLKIWDRLLVSIRLHGAAG